MDVTPDESGKRYTAALLANRRLPGSHWQACFLCKRCSNRWLHIYRRHKRLQSIITIRYAVDSEWTGIWWKGNCLRPRKATGDIHQPWPVQRNEVFISMQSSGIHIGRGAHAWWHAAHAIDVGTCTWADKKFTFTVPAEEFTTAA